MSKPKRVALSTTLEIRDTCLCLHVQQAARALARRFDDALRPVGLTHGQFSLMNALNQPTPPKLSSVAMLLAMDRTTLTAALKPLQRRGLITIAVDTADARGRRLNLTSAGHALLDRAIPIWRRTHRALDALPGMQAKQLRRNLTPLRP